MFHEFHEILDRTLNPDSMLLSPGATLREIFAFLERHRSLARAMIGPHGDLAFVNRLKNLVKDRMYSIMSARQAADDYPYLESFIVSGYIGVIEAWLSSPHPQTPEEMAAICSNMMAAISEGR